MEQGYARGSIRGNPDADRLRSAKKHSQCWDARGMEDRQRTLSAIKKPKGKRLRYKEPA